MRSDRLGCVGSKDELGGNSTFSIQSDFDLNDGKMSFSLWHAGKLLGKFGLKDPKQTAELQAILAVNRQPFQYRQVKSKIGKTKGKMVRQKITTGRVSLTVWLIQEENHHWYIHVSYLKPRTKPAYEPKGSLAVDLNCDSIAPMQVRIVEGHLQITVLDKRYFDPQWSRGKKRNWLYHQIGALVKMAKAEQLRVVLEYLDFEGSKKWLRTKLGAMLHIMPYRQIRKIFERKCMEQGVPLCYVKASYTSVLGAALDEHPFLGRDQAAAVIIGLRGSQAGNAWLEEHCRKLEREEDPRLRINRKSKFGCRVQIRGRLTERQSEDSLPQGEHPRLDREASGYRSQNLVARSISDLSKAMGNWHFAHKAQCPLPNVWKRSEDQPKCGIRWEPVTPMTPSAVSNCSCSTLRN